MDLSDFLSLSLSDPDPTRDVNGMGESLTPFASPVPTKGSRPFTPDSMHSFSASHNPHLTPAHSVNGEPRSEHSSSPCSLDNFEGISPESNRRLSPETGEHDRFGEYVDEDDSAPEEEPEIPSPLMNGRVWNGSSWVLPVIYMYSYP
jgi:hypothetical protein